MKSFVLVVIFTPFVFFSSVVAHEGTQKIEAGHDCLPALLFQYLELKKETVASSLRNMSSQDAHNLMRDTVKCLTLKASWAKQRKTEFETPNTFRPTLDQTAISFFVRALYDMKETEPGAFPDITCDKLSIRYGDFEFCKTADWRCGFGYGLSGAVCKKID